MINHIMILFITSVNYDINKNSKICRSYVINKITHSNPTPFLSYIFQPPKTRFFLVSASIQSFN